MEKIYTSLNDLPQVVLDSHFIGGTEKNYHRLFLYDDSLIKVNKYLYYAAYDREIGKLRKELINQALTSPSIFIQTKLLEKKQRDVLLSSFPKGIFYVNHIPSGIILNYHRDYRSLQNYFIKDYKEFLIILRRILIRIKELDDNDIYQRDLNLSNILYNNENVELIDLDGPFIKIGRDPKIRKAMYFKYLNNIMILLQYRSRGFHHVIDHVSRYMDRNDPSYDNCARLIDEMEEMEEKCNYRV